MEIKINQKRINEVFNTNSLIFDNNINNDIQNGNYSRGSVFLKRVLKFLGNNKAKIFDYGCGTGRISFLLSKEGYDVTGVDPAEDHIKIALSNSKDSNPHFEILNDEYCFPDKSMDAVVSSSVYEFIPEVDLYIENIRKMLKPNGYLFISVPNRLSFWRLYARIRFGKKFEHFSIQKNILSKSEIFQKFEANGFVSKVAPIYFESVLDKKNLGFLNRIPIFGTLCLFTFQLKSH